MNLLQSPRTYNFLLPDYTDEPWNIIIDKGNLFRTFSNYYSKFFSFDEIECTSVLNFRQRVTPSADGSDSQNFYVPLTRIFTDFFLKVGLSIIKYTIGY